MKQKTNELSITNDYIFKKIFSKKGNESILKDFLIAILDIPIEKIQVQAEVSLEKELEENKLGRLDLLATLNDDTIINIEIQIEKQQNFIDRSLYYWSGNYYNDLKKGHTYLETKKTIGINILDYQLFEEGPYHEIARLKREYNNKPVTDKMEIHYIQLPKFIKERKGTETKLEQWMQFLCQKNEEEVQLAMEKNKEIKKANEEYELLTGEEYERRLAYLIDKTKKDYNTLMESAKIEGLKQGISKNKKETAKKLLELEMPIEKIAEVTGLAKEEIEKMKNKK